MPRSASVLDMVLRHLGLKYLGLTCLGLIYLSLTGCTASGGGIAGGATYDLVSSRSAAARTAPVELLVYEPAAVEYSLSSNRLAVRPGPAQISYYKDAGWKDRLPRLVQARLIDSFEASGAVKSVSKSSGTVGLATELRAFEVDVANGRSMSEVFISAKLIDTGSSRILASREFRARVPARTDNPEDVVGALNKAFAKVQRDMVAWVARHAARR